MVSLIDSGGSQDFLRREEVDFGFDHFEVDDYLCDSARGTIRKLSAACMNGIREMDLLLLKWTSRYVVFDLGIEMTRLCAYALGA